MTEQIAVPDRRLETFGIKTGKLLAYLKQYKIEAGIMRVYDGKHVQELFGRRFFGHDNDYADDIIYKVREFTKKGTGGLLTVDALTSPPRPSPWNRRGRILCRNLHLEDIEVTDVFNLAHLAKHLDLSTDNFHWYV